ncbi:MAG: 5-formyltetrahydrofolate cyclo-ligase [Candidatus Aenigmatarchaeota archaeon]
MIFLKDEKKKLREEIWNKMERLKFGKPPFPLKGRIPNFVGSEKAAEKIRELEEWKRAKVIFANPDFAQQKVRELALLDGKILIMASPRLKLGYLKIDPKKVKGMEKFASTIKGALKFGEKLKELIKPDLIVIGCVAVDKNFYRLGKGGGYGDREIKTFKEKFGDIPVVTTIHECQIVDKVPVEENDTRVDVVITPEKIIRFGYGDL